MSCFYVERTEEGWIKLKLWKMV